MFGECAPFTSLQVIQNWGKVVTLTVRCAAIQRHLDWRIGLWGMSWHSTRRNAKVCTWWGIIPGIRTGWRLQAWKQHCKEGSGHPQHHWDDHDPEMCLCDQRQSAASWAALYTAQAAGWGKGLSSTGGSSNCNAGSSSGLPRGTGKSPAKGQESDEGAGKSEKRFRDLGLLRLKRKILGETHQAILPGRREWRECQILFSDAQ